MNDPENKPAAVPVEESTRKAARSESRGSGDRDKGSREINPYDEAIDMPQDFSISLKEKGGTDRLLLAEVGNRRHSMRGFDDSYSDIIDYIVRITHRIWEDKNIGHIYDTYRHNCRVTDDSGLQYARDRIIANTVHTVNAFPNVRLYADEIVWAGDDVSGFRTSHRTVIVGDNTGFSKYGAPTGRHVAVWCIANCRALENEIYDEYVIYNESAMIVQLGFDLRDMARTTGNDSAEELNGLVDRRFGEVERVQGQGKPEPVDRIDPGQGGNAEAMLRRAFHSVWNWRNLSAVDDYYAATMRYFGPTGREFYGRGEYKSFVLSFLAMFPDLGMQVDEVYYMGNDAEGYLTSTRWSAVGTHHGNGIYGSPTGRRVYMWGITQHRVVDGRITEEWMMFNEFQLMQQIYREDGGFLSSSTKYGSDSLPEAE